MTGNLAFALAAGMVATVNPCGFALLPAYLSAFVGLDDRASRYGVIGRAVVVSAAMTAGFIAVFGIFGAVLTQVFGGLERQMPWATIVIGIALFGLGIYLVSGRELVVRIPKLNRGGGDGTILSMFLFGVSYAIASLSCTLPAFIAATVSSFRQDDYLAGVLSFIAYGVGMGVVVTVVTVAVALAKQGIVQRFRSVMPKVNRIAGGLLLIAGLYVAYYGWYEIRVVRQGLVNDPIIGWAQGVQQRIAGLMPSSSSAPWIVGAVIVVGAGIGLWRCRRSVAD